MSEQNISIVIPTLNAASTLPRLLDSIYPHDRRETEVIVVDGGSSDSTLTVARAGGARTVQLSLPGDSRSSARNLGAKLACSSNLLFLDADMELTTGLISEVTGLLSDGYDAIVVPEFSIGGDSISRLKNWENRAKSGHLELFFARGIRSDVFWKAGAFDPALSGLEDLDLQARMIERGTRFHSSRRGLVHHEENLNWPVYLSRTLRYARSARSYSRKHPTLSRVSISTSARLAMYVRGIRTAEELPLFVMACIARAFAASATYWPG